MHYGAEINVSHLGIKGQGHTRITYAGNGPLHAEAFSTGHSAVELGRIRSCESETGFSFRFQCANRMHKTANQPLLRRLDTPNLDYKAMQRCSQI